MFKDFVKIKDMKQRTVLLYDTLSQILDTQEKVDKVGQDKIVAILQWFNEKSANYRGGDSKTREMFRQIIGDVYGEHAYNVLKQRPNLHFENIKDYRVFEKSIYDTMGENFIHQLLNFDYSMVCQNNYSKIIDDLINNESKRGSFKFCYGIVKEDANDVYNYTKLFLTYSRYGELIDDCYNKKDSLTSTEMLTLKDVILSKENVYHIMSKRDLGLYDNRVKNHFEDVFVKDSTIDSYIKAILERFFGIFSPYEDGSESEYDDAKHNLYTRDAVSMKILKEVYRIDRLIIFEENAKKLGRTPLLNKEELYILKLISAIDKIYNYSDLLTSEQENLIPKLYKTLEENQHKIVHPSDVRSLILKIPTLYADDVKRSLTGIKQFEDAITNKVSGIRKEYITRQTSFGTTIQVPVYHLEGYEYKALVTSVQENMSGLSTDYFKQVPKWYYTRKLDDLLGGAEEAEKNRAEYRVTMSRQIVKLWFEKEGRTNSCVACSYDTSKTPSAIEITGSYVGTDVDLDQEERVVYMMPQNSKIIAMGPTDTFSSSVIRNPNISTLLMYTQFSTAEALENESFGTNYNEVDIERYTTTSNLRASRIIPEALYKKGKQPTEMIVEHAVVMTEYLTKHGLKPKDYVFPIVMVDRSFYHSPEIVENRMNEIKNYFKAIKNLDVNEGITRRDRLSKSTELISGFVCSLNNEHQNTSNFDENKTLSQEVDIATID